MEHICEVCCQVVSDHQADCGNGTFDKHGYLGCFHFPPLCCPGCPCRSFEEAHPAIARELGTLTPCGQRLEGWFVRMRLGKDLAGPFVCNRDDWHAGACADTSTPDVKVWWWTWGNSRLQIRGYDKRVKVQA